MQTQTEAPSVELDMSYRASGIGILRLNRPKPLHALNLDMVGRATELLSELERDDLVRVVWLESSTPKAFCAGGDVRAIRQAVLDGAPERGDAFFKQEYALDLALHRFTKPIIAWADGYVMGGGMGLMMACPFRIITENSKCAMPEVQIGLFPDVGASRFLAERGRVGLFLGLTGSIISSADAFLIRWANYISRFSKKQILEQLANTNWAEFDNPFAVIAQALGSIHKPLAGAPLQESLDSINSVCRGEDFASDYTGLKNLSEAQNPWLKTAGDNVTAGAPSTVALTWLLWQWGQHTKSWQQVFELEYCLAVWKIRHPDFVEGVRARLVDKDLSPAWCGQNTQSLSEILPELPHHDDAEWLALLNMHGIKAV